MTGPAGEPKAENVGGPLSVDVKTEAEQDAALDKIFDERGVGEDEPSLVPDTIQLQEEARREEPKEAPEKPQKPARERDEHGRFKPKEQPQEAVEQVSEAPEAKSDTPAPESGELEKALAALRLDKVPDDVVSKLSPAEQLALGNAIRERRSAHDKTLNELAELKKQAPEESGAGEPPAALDLSETVKPFAEEFGEEAGSALKGILEGVLGPMQAQMAALSQGTAQSFMETQRALLRDSFPAVADADTWTQVREKAVQLAQLDGYDDETAMSDACRLVCGEPKDPSATAAELEAEAREHRDRANGQPTLGITNPGTAPLSFDERQDKVLDSIFDGATKDEARAVWRT